ASPATVRNFPGFTDRTGLQLNGNAAPKVTADGTVLRLVTASGNEHGSAFTTEKVDATAFSTQFTFRMTNPGGIPDLDGDVGPDGRLFALQRDGANVGGAGGAIGFAGLAHSFGLEFDTCDNGTPGDPSSNHIGVDVNGSLNPVVTHNAATPFDDGNLWTVWID